jgi:modulator of FtsH protease
MSLYDREYMNTSVSSGINIQAFVKQTYQLFAASLLMGTIGAYVGVMNAELVHSFKWIIFIAEIGLLIGLHFVKHKPGINLAVLFAFGLFSGLSIGPLIYNTLGFSGGGNIVAGSFLTTTIIFGGLSIFAMTSKIDFTKMGKVLFVALILLIIASVVNMFIMDTMFQVVISSLAAVIFSAFILYDTQNIIKGNYETPIDGAIALYLDFFNLFVALLQIFGIFGKDE